RKREKSKKRERKKVGACSASFVSKYKVKQVWMAARVLHTRAVFLHCSQWKRSMPVSLSRPNRSQGGDQAPGKLLPSPGPQPEAGRSRLLTDLPGSAAPAQPRAAPACRCPPPLGGPVSTCSPAPCSPILLSPEPRALRPRPAVAPRSKRPWENLRRGGEGKRKKKRKPKKVQGRVEGEERRGGSKPHRPTSKLSEDLCRGSVISMGCRDEG
ncbi:hypothetical protein A6R68_17940, partial [Neotoma lepida]